MKELVGKIVEKILIDRNLQEYLQFKTKQGDVIYQTEADCCSETWFADIINVEGFFSTYYGKGTDGRMVQSVEEIEMPEVADDRTRQQSDQAYGYRIKTNAATITIVFRNSSNGYYGGGIRLIKKLPDGIEMIEITEDYSA